MNRKLYAKIVIAVGVLLMIYARHMDVTYMGVVNLHKLSQQNTMMMFGGFIFLGGLILFAVARIKQTKEDEAEEKADSEEAAEARKKKAEEAIAKGTKTASSFVEKISSHFSAPQDMRSARLATGLFVGLTLSLSAAVFISIGSVVVFIALVWAAYRNVPAPKALRPLHGVNMGIYAVQAIMVGMAVFLPRLSTDETGSQLIIVPMLIMSAISLVSAYFFWRLGKAR